MQCESGSKAGDYDHVRRVYLDNERCKKPATGESPNGCFCTEHGEEERHFELYG